MDGVERAERDTVPPNEATETRGFESRSEENAILVDRLQTRRDEW